MSEQPMASPERQDELWRAKYQARAYVDQTGRALAGSVVHEQITVTDTGERYDVDDGYSVHHNLGRICVSEDGRRFRLHPETVDYSGGLHVRQENAPEGQVGYWQRPPWLPTGYVYSDGSGPVRYLLLTEAEIEARERKVREEKQRRADELRRQADRIES